MRQAVHEIEVSTRGQGLYEITADAADWAESQDFNIGLLTLFCRHTSASLLIQENADPTVSDDIARYFAAIAPESTTLYSHSSEGPDDMPAHLRAALTQTHLTVPIVGGRLALGTWQGLFLFEHRSRPHRRHAVLHGLGG